MNISHKANLVVNAFNLVVTRPVTRTKQNPKLNKSKSHGGALRRKPFLGILAGAGALDESEQKREISNFLFEKSSQTTCSCPGHPTDWPWAVLEGAQQHRGKWAPGAAGDRGIALKAAGP